MSALQSADGCVRVCKLDDCFAAASGLATPSYVFLYSVVRVQKAKR
jgi:hypothetical protein